MNAFLSFRKEAAKPTVLTFRRSDGSQTWSMLRLPIGHDLAHYAVETVLQLRQAFFGLLDQGFSTDDFELPRERRQQALLPANLPLEALQTEHIVALLQTEWACGRNVSFTSDLMQSLTDKGLAYPHQLTAERLEEIRKTYSALMNQWDKLPAGQQLNLAIRIY